VWFCTDILTKHNKTKYKRELEVLEDYYDEEEKDLAKFFGWNVYEDKLQELRDAIVKPYTQYAPGRTRNVQTQSRELAQPSLFPDSTKYVNHTNKTTSFSSSRIDDDRLSKF
jgi:hypothetical protein